MNGELSHRLPRLTIWGNRIVNPETNKPVLLRGVNRSGMEYSEPNDEGFARAAGISQDEVECIAKNWNCNILRVPFNQDWALNGRRSHSSEEYLRDLDRIIQWAAECGAYTLLALQWLNADLQCGGKLNFIAPLPNLESIELWHILAHRYLLLLQTFNVYSQAMSLHPRKHTHLGQVMIQVGPFPTPLYL